MNKRRSYTISVSPSLATHRCTYSQLIYRMYYTVMLSENEMKPQGIIIHVQNNILLSSIKLTFIHSYI